MENRKLENNEGYYYLNKTRDENGVLVNGGISEGNVRIIN